MFFIKETLSEKLDNVARKWLEKDFETRIPGLRQGGKPEKYQHPCPKCVYNNVLYFQINVIFIEFDKACGELIPNETWDMVSTCMLPKTD